MAFTIDFATGSASTKVDGLTKQVVALSDAANSASQALENSFKRGAVAKTTADSIKPISRQVAALSSNLEKLDISPLNALYATLKNPLQSTKELQDLSNSIFKLSRTLPLIDERNLEALFEVLKKKPSHVSDLNSLASSFTAIAQALPSIQPTPIRKLFNALEKYKPIGGDLEKLGKGFESIAKALPTIQPEPVAALFKTLEGYKPIGGELHKMGLGFSAIAKATPKIDSTKVKVLMDALAEHTFSGEQLRVIANSISLIARSTEKLNPKPLQEMFKVIANYPKVTQEINDLAKALQNLAAAQGKANTQAMKKMVGDAMGGNTNAAMLAGFSQDQIKMMKSVGDKYRFIAESQAIWGKSARDAEPHIRNFAKSMRVSEQTSASLRASMNALGTHMGIFTGRTIAVATAVYTTISAFKAMITTGTSFTKEMTRATAVMNATSQESLMLEARVRELARETVYTSVQVSEGLTYLGMAGLTSSEAMAALEPTLNIAKIGMIEFSESADIVTNVLRAFKINATDLSHVADDLATAITNSNATIQQLAKALSYVAPIAYAAGGGIREVTALLTVMHDVGIKSSRAGTALRRAYGNLLAPTDKVTNTLQKLNVSSHDANGRLRSMVSIFLDLANRGATSADVMNLFGVRASSALQSILDDINSVNPKLRQMMLLLANNEGAAKDLGETFEEYLGADAQKLVSALQDKFIEIFKVNEEGFRKITKDLTEFIKTLDAAAIGSWIDKMVELVKWMYEFRVAISYTGAAILASPLVVVFGASLYQIARAAWWLAKMIGKVGLAVANFTTKAHPFLAILTSVGAAAYYLYDVYQDLYGSGSKVAKTHEENAKAIKKEAESREALNKKTLDIQKPERTGSHTDQLFSDDTHAYMNPTQDYVIDNNVMDRMNTLYEKQIKTLDAIRDNNLIVNQSARDGIAALEAMGWQGDAVNERMAHYKKLIQESTDALGQLRGDYTLLKNQLADAMEFGVLPEDIKKRQEFEKATIEIMNAVDYDARESRFNDVADAAIAEIERLQELDRFSNEVATAKIEAIEKARYGNLIADVETQLKDERARLDKLMERYNINSDGTIDALGKSRATGEKIPATKELSGNLDELIDQKAKVDDLTESLRQLKLESNETAEQLRHDLIVEIIKEGQFDGAIEDLQKYNGTIDASISSVNAEIQAIKTGNKVRDALLTATELQMLADTDALIVTQELALARLNKAGADQQEIDKIKEKIELLKLERAILDMGLDNLQSAREGKVEAGFIKKLQEFEKGAMELMTSIDYGARESKFNSVADSIIAEIERLEQLDRFSSEVATSKIEAIERVRYSNLIADVEDQLKIERKKFDQLKKKYDISDDGSIEALRRSYETGEPLSGSMEIGDLNELTRQKEAVDNLVESLISLQGEADETYRQLRHDLIIEVIKEGQFDGAVKDIRKYNQTIDDSIDVINAEVKAIKSGEKTREDLLTATEIQRLADTDALIMKQELQLQTLRNIRADQKDIDNIEKKIELLKLERAILDMKLDDVRTARDDKEEATFIKKLQEFEKETIELMNLVDYGERESRFNDVADTAIAEIERLQELDRFSNEVATAKIEAIERSRYANLITDVKTQLAEEKQKFEELKTKYGVSDDGTIEKLRQSYETGDKLHGNMDIGDINALTTSKNSVDSLTGALRTLNLQASETGKTLRHDLIVETIKEGKFDGAVEGVRKYNDTIDTSIEKINAEISAIQNGTEVRDALLTATEQQRLKDADALIMKQELALATLTKIGADQKDIDKLREKINLLKLERDILDMKLDDLAEARGGKQDAEDLEKEKERLKKLKWLPREHRDIVGYDDNVADVKKHYELNEGLPAEAMKKGFEPPEDWSKEQLSKYEEYLDARLAVDTAYVEAAHDIYIGMFDDIADAMGQALVDVQVYDAEWGTVAENIRNQIYSSIIKGIWDWGAEYARVGAIKLAMLGKEFVAENFLSAAKVANSGKEAVAETAKIATVQTAETTAAAASAATASGVLGSVVGEAAAAASAWSPAAVNASVATMGGAAATGAAALAVAHAQNLALSSATSVASDAVGGGGAVKGRANGGRVEAGTPYLVGENSAEVFVPDRAGTIINERQNKQKGSPFGGKGDGGSEQSPQDIKIINAIDPDFIKDYLASSEGEQVIINHIQRNKGSF